MTIISKSSLTVTNSLSPISYLQVCLGLEFLNSNKSAEMTQILESAQRLYVPTAEVDGEIVVLEKVIFDGDQLTEERARNAQWANVVADTSFDRLEGLEPTFGDWHLKKNLYHVCIYRTLYIITQLQLVQHVSDKQETNLNVGQSIFCKEE